MKRIQNFSIRFWMLLLVWVSTISLFAFCTIVYYIVSTEKLEEHTLDINQVYANKIAETADVFFQSAQQNLETRSNEIANQIDNKQELQKKLDLLLQSGISFNSILAADKRGILLATSPSTGLEGRRVDSIGAKQALDQKIPLISEPYKAITGRLIVLVSTPMWDNQGNYLGFLAGTIYLEKENMLQHILGKHFNTNGSYVYVVDKYGHLIYHPEKKRLGELVASNPVIKKLMNGQSGAEKVTNTQGVDMLAGYAYIPSSEWGVVSQTPYTMAVEPTMYIVVTILQYTLPILVFLLFGTYLFIHKAVVPLKRLAHYSDKLAKTGVFTPLPEFSTWYFESRELRKAIQSYTESLERKLHSMEVEALTDVLTGLVNRRAIENSLHLWIKNGVRFSVILLDIDRFKNINDKFGHQTGDDVLKFISDFMKAGTRSKDICGRLGGEEFVILLPDANAEQAFEIAERFRLQISKTSSPTGEPITISIGISVYPDMAKDGQSLLQLADVALYKAKESRNKTVISKIE